jgi:hypothetical protein
VSQLLTTSFSCAPSLIPSWFFTCVTGSKEDAATAKERAARKKAKEQRREAHLIGFAIKKHAMLVQERCV